MKVKLTKETKKWMTLAEAPAARRMIEDLKTEYTDTAADIAVAAARVIIPNGGYKTVKVLEASAVIAGNGRIWNYWGEDTGRLDVWVDAIVVCDDYYAEIGCYISDVYNLGDDDSKTELKMHSFSRLFKLVEK